MVLNKEAWHLLRRQREKEGTLEIHACAVEWLEERVSWQRGFGGRCEVRRICE